MVQSGEGEAETRYAAAKQCEALERQRGATEEQSCELHATLWQGDAQCGQRSEIQSIAAARQGDAVVMQSTAAA